jgi:hypothetical protein
MDNFIIPKNPNHFSLEERHVLIQDYLSSGYSKSYIWHKYTGQEDHGRMLKWMRQLGYETRPQEFRHRFVRTYQQIMAEKRQKLLSKSTYICKPKTGLMLNCKSTLGLTNKL